MSSFDDVYGGFIVMVTLCVMALILALLGGYLIDQLWEFFNLAGAVDLNDNWGSISVQNQALNLYYLVICIMPVAGVASFVKSVIKRQGYNQYLLN